MCVRALAFVSRVIHDCICLERFRYRMRTRRARWCSGPWQRAPTMASSFVPATPCCPCSNESLLPFCRRHFVCVPCLFACRSDAFLYILICVVCVYIYMSSLVNEVPQRMNTNHMSILEPSRGKFNALYLNSETDIIEIGSMTFTFCPRNTSCISCPNRTDMGH